MIPVEPDRNRRIAAFLADSLAPLIADLPTEPPVAVIKRVYVEADRGLVKAAERVALAVDRLAQAKFTPGEISARMALERAALSLRAEMRKRSVQPQPSHQEPTK